MEILAVWALFCLIPAYVAAQKDRSPLAWFLIALLISPLIALIVVAVIPSAKPAALAPAPPVVGVADELTKLVALRDAGAITQEEFDRQRNLLLPAPVPVSWGPDTKAGANMACGRCHKPLSPAWKGKCEHCKATYAMYPPVPRG